MDKEEKEMIWNALECLQAECDNMRKRLKNIEIFLWGAKQVVKEK